MNRALRFFGGKKGLLIPFLVFLALSCLMCVTISLGSVTMILGNIILIATMVGIWLEAKSIVLFIGIIISAILRNSFIVLDLTLYLKFGLSYLMPHIALLFLLIYCKKKALVIKILFIVFYALTLLIPIICGISNNLEYFGFVNSLIYALIRDESTFLFGAITFLWLPLEIFTICPKCWFRNMKGASFCGGCGNKLN